MTPQERRELHLDAAEQTEEWNRAMREEERDAQGLWHPSDDQPDGRELAEMARWDRETDRRERDAREAGRADW